MFQMISVLVMSLLSFSALGSFHPDHEPRPHTGCWDQPKGGIKARKGQLRVFLTDVQANSRATRVEIQKLEIQEQRLILSWETQLEVWPKVDVYQGDSFRLMINRRAIDQTTQRLAKLEYISEEGNPTSVSLLCDTLMYPMDKGPANF